MYLWDWQACVVTLGQNFPWLPSSSFKWAIENRHTPCPLQAFVHSLTFPSSLRLYAYLCCWPQFLSSQLWLSGWKELRGCHDHCVAPSEMQTQDSSSCLSIRSFLLWQFSLLNLFSRCHKCLGLTRHSSTMTCCYLYLNSALRMRSILKVASAVWSLPSFVSLLSSYVWSDLDSNADASSTVASCLASRCLEYQTSSSSILRFQSLACTQVTQTHRYAWLCCSDLNTTSPRQTPPLSSTSWPSPVTVLISSMEWASDSLASVKLDCLWFLY